MLRSSCRTALCLALAGCGPSVALDEATTTGGETSSASGPVEPPEPTTSGTPQPPAPATTVTDDDGTGSDATSGDVATGTAGDEGCAFLAGCQADLGEIGECDLYTQNCPPGSKCMPWANDGGPAWNATRCSPLAESPFHVGEPCLVEGSGVSGIDDCDTGLMCWNVDETGMGVCEDLCTGSAAHPICPNPDDQCAVANDGFIALCISQCHPLLQDCAIRNEICKPFDDLWSCAPDCSCGGLGAYGDPCEYQFCDQGSACIGTAAFSRCSGTFGCCSSICDLNDAGADAKCQALDPAQTCEPWYAEGQAPIGYADVGVCMIAGSL